MKAIKHFRELDVYKLAFESAMEIFEISKKFPSEEKFSLTDQIRRSSRSVCSNIAESWRKRRYKLSFINKLSDAMSEACETQSRLGFCLSSKYITLEAFNKLDSKCELIISKLNGMELKADSFCFKSP